MMIGPCLDWKGKWLKLGLKWWVKGDEMQEVRGKWTFLGGSKVENFPNVLAFFELGRKAYGPDKIGHILV